MVILSGCYASGPINNLAFNDGANLKSLEGVYQNIGEADLKSIPANCPDCRRRLSEIIWPGDKSLDHKTIDAIEVRNTEEKTLTVKALEKGKVKKESLFVEGRNFTFKAGRIHLKTEVFFAAPVIGPSWQTIEIGLDSEGNGKYREESGTAGLAFFVIPVAVTGTDDVRFVRMTK
jgi:hypothetical protein